MKSCDRDTEKGARQTLLQHPRERSGGWKVEQRSTDHLLLLSSFIPPSRYRWAGIPVHPRHLLVHAFAQADISSLHLLIRAAHPDGLHPDNVKEQLGGVRQRSRCGGSQRDWGFCRVVSRRGTSTAGRGPRRAPELPGPRSPAAAYPPSRGPPPPPTKRFGLRPRARRRAGSRLARHVRRDALPAATPRAAGGWGGC